MPRRLHPLIYSLLVMLLCGIAQAADFVMPAEVNPPFRRDQLPIDADSMSMLSEDLTLLSQALSLDGAPGRRTAAQTLALALALEPGNSVARETLDMIAEGQTLTPPLSHHLPPTKTRIWEMHAWLSSPEAGPNGNLLGDMLGDVAAMLDPENATAQVLASAPERGKWDKLIAPLSSFEEKTAIEDELADTDPTENDSKTPSAENSLNIQLNEATILTITRTQVRGEWRFPVTPVTMRAEPRPGAPFRLTVTGDDASQTRIDRVIKPLIEKSLEHHYGNLPSSGRVRILANTGRAYSFASNRDALTGPGFVLANAALSGRAPAGVVLARLTQNHGLTSPSHFWQMISSLPEDQGQRLVVAKDSEEFFLSILTLENPDFFLKHEILAASNLEDLIEFSSAEPSEKYAEAYTQFAEIQAKAKNNATGTYLANFYVRQKLAEIIAAAPHHLSAKMLARQGAGERPRFLKTEILAAEILRVIQPVGAIASTDLTQAVATAASGEETYEKIKAELSQLERYSDLRDRSFITDAHSLMVNLKSYNRSLRGGRNDDVARRTQAARAARTTLREANQKLVEKLSEAFDGSSPEEKE